MGMLLLFSGGAGPGTVYTKTGSLAAGTKNAGADVSTHIESGNVHTATQNSGSSSTILPQVYIKTGSLQTRQNINASSSGGTHVDPGRPAACPAAEELYEILKPLAYDDRKLGWPLLKYCIAVACPVQVVKNYGADWSQILDVDRAPSEALPWLAQVIGSTLDPQKAGETDVAYDVRARAYIRSTPGFNRGTTAAMTAAIQQHLTGTKTVIIRERHGGPYKLQVRTKVAETPSEAEVLTAINLQKPAGITLDYDSLAGQDYTTLLSGHPTYQNVYTYYATYNGVYLDIAGA